MAPDDVDGGASQPDESEKSRDPDELTGRELAQWLARLESGKRDRALDRRVDAEIQRAARWAVRTTNHGLDIDDVAQRTALRLWRSKTFDPERRARPWISEVAKNLARDLTKLANRPDRDTDQLPEHLLASAAEGPEFPDDGDPRPGWATLERLRQEDPQLHEVYVVRRVLGLRWGGGRSPSGADEPLPSYAIEWLRTADPSAEFVEKTLNNRLTRAQVRLGALLAEGDPPGRALDGSEPVEVVVFESAMDRLAMEDPIGCQRVQVLACQKGSRRPEIETFAKKEELPAEEVEDQLRQAWSRLLDLAAAVRSELCEDDESGDVR